MTNHNTCQTNPDCQKKAAFHNTCMDAWVQTRMEKDRQLLTLSSLAIGLLMIFHTELGTLTVFFLWLFAAACFLICIMLVLMTFTQNADYLVAAAGDDDKSAVRAELLEKRLAAKTKFLGIFFVLGVIATLSLAVAKTGYTITKTSIQKEEVEMSNDKGKTNEGFEGFTKMKPVQPQQPKPSAPNSAPTNKPTDQSGKK